MAHTKVTKTYSQNTGAANTFSYSGSFDVFKGTEVVALLDNVLLTYTASTINESASPREYTVDTSAKTIHIGGANLSSGVVIIRPETDMGAPTPRADYTPGASITSADLNNNQLQLMRKAMEYDEQKLSSTGGTMTGDLTMGEDTTIVFEGDTDDAYETTLTVTDPTADRTITLPNVSGTVVTTGDTGSVTATMLAANSVDSSELVDGSIDNSHLADDAVNSDEIASGAVDLDHMSANSVGEHQYVDASIKTAHIGNDQIDSQHYAAGSIDNEHMASDSIDSAQYVDGSIDLAHMSVNSVSTDQYVDNSIQHVHLQNDIIDGDNIQDDVINSEHIAAGAVDLEHMSSASVDSDNIVDDTIVNADINSSAAIALTKLANVSSGQVIVGNGSNVPTAVAMSGDVAIAAGGATTIQTNAIDIAMVACDQQTITDSDNHIPTSGAVVDYVAAAIAPIGGLEVIADDESFPNTIPPAGVVISITDCAGLSVNSSGVSTNGDALDNSTITINGFPSELRGGVGGNADPYVFASGAGLMVQSTGSSHTYNYHQALIREADFVQLSDDISDFNSRYRIGTKTADNHSSNDDGDLFFDTGANKMYVYDGAYNSGGTWKEVTSAGDFKFLGIKTNGQAHDGSLTFDGNATQFDLFDGSSDASITSAAQLIVVLNGVVQKPNSGTYSGSEEGFYLDGSDGIRFCDGPPSNSVCFVTQIGSAVALNEPADNTVSEAKIQVGAVSHTRLAADCVDGDNLQDNAVDSEHYTDGSIDHVHLAGDCVDGDNLADNACDSEHYTDGSIDHVHLAADIVDGDIIADDAVGAEHIEDLDADIKFIDNEGLILGTDNDAALKFNGTDTLLTTAGKIKLYPDGDLEILDNSSGEYRAKFIDDGAVELYHNNVKKLETTATGATVTGSVIADNTPGRNLIINGGFQIAQRSASNNTAGASSTYNTLDRWMVQIQSGTVTEMRNDLTSSDTGPWQKGFRNYMRLLNQSGIGAGSTQYAEIDQRIEAQNVTQSGWDYTSSSSNITLSFWIRASVAQAYVAVIYSSDGTGRHYPFEIKDSGGSTLSANTWTKITKTIPGNSGITVNNDTGRGLTVSLLAAYGTNWTSSSGSFDSWNTTGGGNDRFPDMTNTWATTTNATFDVTGVQLEVGSVATDFEHRSYADELLRCQRYYNKYQEGNSVYIGETSFQYSSSICITPFHFSPEMRATPSLDDADGTNYFTVFAAGSGTDFDTFHAINSMNNKGGCVNANVSGSAGEAAGIHLSNSSAYIAFDAEL